MGPEFEWHAAKAGSNFQAHGVVFELAQTAFRDPFATELTMTVRIMVRSVWS